MTKDVDKLMQCVDEFAVEMKSKLLDKHIEGWKGWDDPEYMDAIKLGMITAVNKQQKNPMTAGQEVDIANFAMFLWNLNQQTKEE